MLVQRYPHLVHRALGDLYLSKLLLRQLQSVEVVVAIYAEVHVAVGALAILQLKSRC